MYLRNEEALSLAVKALRELCENWGDKDQITLNAMRYVAATLCKLGKQEDAIKLQEIVYENLKGVLGEKNSETITTRMDLAASHQAVGRFEEATIHGESALAASMETFGIRDFRTLTAMKMAADSARRCKKYFHKCIRNLSRGVWGPSVDVVNHVQIIQSILSFGRLDEAVSLAVQRYIGVRSRRDRWTRWKAKDRQCRSHRGALALAPTISTFECGRQRHDERENRNWNLSSLRMNNNDSRSCPPHL